MRCISRGIDTVRPKEASSQVEPVPPYCQSAPSSARMLAVRPPRLIGLRGGLYYLDNRPMPVPGRRHLEFRRRRTPPRPHFPGHPPIDWCPADSKLRAPLWGLACHAARTAIDELVRKTARRLNIYVVDDQVGGETGRPVKQPALNIVDVRDLTFIASQIVAAARHCHEWSLAWAESLVIPRMSGKPIVIAWQTYDASTTDRLRSLLRIAEGGTQARLELHWYQASSAMRHFICREAVGWPRGERHVVPERAVVSGDMISAPMPSREFLRAVLPEAIKASARQRGRRVIDADVFLALVREMFLMLAGDGNDRLRVRRLEVPNGVGADFVRAIEGIFSVRLLDEASLHAVMRVRELAKAIGERRLRRPRLKRPQITDYPAPQD